MRLTLLFCALYSLYSACFESDFKYMGTGKVMHSCGYEEACRGIFVTVQHHKVFEIECFDLNSCYETNFKYFGDVGSEYVHSCKGALACKYSRVTTFGPLRIICDGTGNSYLPCEGMSINVINQNEDVMLIFDGDVATIQSPIRIFSVHGLKQSQIVCDNNCDQIIIIYGFKFDQSCRASNISCYNDMENLNIANGNLLVVSSYIENTFNYTELDQNVLYVLPTLIDFKIPSFRITNPSYWLSIFVIDVFRSTTTVTNDLHDFSMYDNVAITNFNGTIIWDTTFIGPKQKFIRNSYYQVWQFSAINEDHNDLLWLGVNRNTYYLNATVSSHFNSVEYRYFKLTVL